MLVRIQPIRGHLCWQYQTDIGYCWFGSTPHSVLLNQMDEEITSTQWSFGKLMYHHQTDSIHWRPNSQSAFTSCVVSLGSSLNKNKDQMFQLFIIERIIDLKMNRKDETRRDKLPDFQGRVRMFVHYFFFYVCDERQAPLHVWLKPEEDLFSGVKFPLMAETRDGERPWKAVLRRQNWIPSISATAGRCRRCRCAQEGLDCPRLRA